MIEQRGKRLISHTYNVKDRQPYCALVKAQFVFCARGVESAGDVRLAIRDSCAHWILHISADPVEVFRKKADTLKRQGIPSREADSKEIHPTPK